MAALQLQVPIIVASAQPNQCWSNNKQTLHVYKRKDEFLAYVHGLCSLAKVLLPVLFIQGLRLKTQPLSGTYQLVGKEKLARVPA